INKFRGELGLPPLTGGIFRDYCHSPDLVIGLFPEWFAPLSRDWPPQTKLTGFPLWDERTVTPMSGELYEFLNAGPGPIVFTPGSAMTHGQDFFAAAVDACARLNRRGLLLS